jgi:DNA-binding MarR family transcriptional regulator
MDDNRLSTYLLIRQKTYHIVESKGIHYIQSMTDQLSLKELSILFTIEQLEKTGQNKPTLIGTQLGMALNHLTYYLNQLVKQKMIKKTMNPTDHREYLINITEVGQKALSFYQVALLTAAQDVQNTLSVFDRLKLIRTLRDIAYPPSKGITPPSLTKVLKAPNKHVQIFLNRVHQENINDDLAFLKRHELDFSLKELRILLEVYIQSNLGHATLLSVYEELKMPISTLGRIIDQAPYIQKKAAKHDQRIKYLSIKKNAHFLFDEFIDVRIKRYNDAREIAGKKAFGLIEAMFKALERFIDSHELTQNSQSH